MSKKSDDGPEVSLVWIGMDDLAILHADQFVIQTSPDGDFIVSIGQVSPPVILGTPEEREARARKIPFVPIRTLGRFSMNAHRLIQLARILSKHIEKADELGKEDEQEQDGKS